MSVWPTSPPASASTLPLSPDPCSEFELHSAWCTGCIPSTEELSQTGIVRASIDLHHIASSQDHREEMDFLRILTKMGCASLVPDMPVC